MHSPNVLKYGPGRRFTGKQLDFEEGLRNYNSNLK